MNWQQAFLQQAQSDHATLRYLNNPAIAYAHRLHYLQMTTEKLAKSTLCGPDGTDQPPLSHALFVRMLQTLKGQPEVRRSLGFKDPSIFRAYIDSLLDAARMIEQLAPAIAGSNLPNPEYPWQDTQTREIFSPASFAFPEFDPLKPTLVKLDRLIRDLLSVL